ncbi:MAG TPA: hypothetical protein VLJ38_16705, partial [Polyangiaceae bacterium]|nr:hypothetical protein [Polyangiaceae bacterium]
MLRLGAISSRTRSSAGRPVLAVFVLALGACGNGGAQTPAGDDASAASAGKGPTTGAAGYSFDLGVRALTTDGLDIDALHLKPSAVADIVAHATPPAAHNVRFALLGTPLDAVLSLTESTTDATTGDAHVRLVAPSTPTTF